MDAVRLQQQDFSLDEETRALRATSGRIGGIAFFLGCARDFSDGRAVHELDFEAYDDMALAELRALRAEALTRFGLIEARLVHRVGRIAAGENIVLVAAAAEHRAPALDACHWLIDELKRRIPIWKKELAADGAAWVTPHP